LDAQGHLGAIADPLRLSSACASNSCTHSDAAALEREVSQVYDAHAASLLGYARAFSGSSDISSDAVQEAFFRYFIFRRQGNGIENARAWLFRVLRNALIDEAKATAHEVALTPDESRSGFDPRGDLDRGIQFSALARTMPSLLSARELECVQLRAEGLQYDEIAVVLNLQSGTVGTLLARAITKLRRALTPEPKCR
jgi:RNA polymerase sigma-70 factor (ECF subfamily)